MSDIVFIEDGETQAVKHGQQEPSIARSQEQP